MATIPVGFEWVKREFRLPQRLTHISFIGSNASMDITSLGNVEQVYGSRYAPKVSNPLYHLEFGLKYDDLNLDFISGVFRGIPIEEVKRYIENSPSGKYSRKIGFLYEMLTGKEISVSKPATGNYTDLLDPGKYITGVVVQNTKWKINDNLIGTAEYCPIIRKTPKLIALLSVNTSEKIKQLQQKYPADIFKRAVRFLYNKETRSSYEIEKENPTADRMEKFVALLMRAGTEEATEILSLDRLIRLQNAIVDGRFAASGFRDFQNYVGETLPNYHDILHYICPPPKITTSLMNGLSETFFKTNEMDAILRATIISFGFVFIHPFEDGNGRLHRFLIHDILVYNGLVPSGLVIPVSAHMLANMKAYDNILERYSSPLMQRVKYTKNDAGEVVITNPQEVEGYYRYPEFTDHCTYLFETIHATIEQDMPGEIDFLIKYDEAKRALQQIVDMPDKMINQMLIFLHQNQGMLSKRRRGEFSKLTDDEIMKMEETYRLVYEIRN